MTRIIIAPVICPVLKVACFGSSKKIVLILGPRNKGNCAPLVYTDDWQCAPAFCRCRW